MVINGNRNYTRNNRGISTEQLLSNAYTTITPKEDGTKRADELGLHCTSTYMAGRSPRFNFDVTHVKLLERTVGMIWIKVSDTALNASKFEDKNMVEHVRNYGGLVGSAGLNMDGQGTLQSDIPCIVIPDHKDHPVQKNAVNESFAALIGTLKGVEAAEVNAASVNIYESTKLVNGLPAFRFAIIEASGLFGTCNGTAFNWSVRMHPVPKAEPTAKPATKSNRTSKSPRVKTPQAPADDQTGDSAEVDALVFAG